MLDRHDQFPTRLAQLALSFCGRSLFGRQYVARRELRELADQLLLKCFFHFRVSYWILLILNHLLGADEMRDDSEPTFKAMDALNRRHFFALQTLQDSDPFTVFLIFVIETFG